MYCTLAAELSKDWSKINVFLPVHSISVRARVHRLMRVPGG